MPEPGEGNERSILLGWLAFHRSVLAATCAGLSDDQLAERPAPPSPLSLLGLVRHLAEMERLYGAWANGCPSHLVRVWGEHVDGGHRPEVGSLGQRPQRPGFGRGGGNGVTLVAQAGYGG